MTVNELSAIYGIKQYVTTKGDDIFIVAFRLYNSTDEKYLAILKQLNLRYDWQNLQPGVSLNYIPNVDFDLTIVW